MELSPGPHRLKAEVTRTFSTTESMGDVTPPGAGGLGHPFSRHGGFRPQSGEAVEAAREVRKGFVTVSGAEVLGDPEDLPLGDRRPHLLRAGGRRYVLIGKSPNEVVFQAGKSPPAWLHHVGLGDVVQFVDVESTFVPAWALIEDSTRALSIRAMTPGPPVGDATQISQQWIDSISEWREARVTGDVDGWAAYVHLADELAQGPSGADR
jgi:hypothetical protein